MYIHRKKYGRNTCLTKGYIMKNRQKSFNTRGLDPQKSITDSIKTGEHYLIN